MSNPEIDPDLLAATSKLAEELLLKATEANDAAAAIASLCLAASTAAAVLDLPRDQFLELSGRYFDAARADLASVPLDDLHDVGVLPFRKGDRPS